MLVLSGRRWLGKHLFSFFAKSVYETDWLQVYAQLFGFASSFFSFLKSQKLRRNFQAWRAVGSNDLFDAAWLLEADVGFLHPGYDDFSGANFNGGSVIFMFDRNPRDATTFTFKQVFRNCGLIRNVTGINRVMVFKRRSTVGLMIAGSATDVSFSISRHATPVPTLCIGIGVQEQNVFADSHSERATAADIHKFSCGSIQELTQVRLASASTTDWFISQD